MHVPLVLAYTQLRQVVEALSKDVAGFNKYVPSIEPQQNISSELRHGRLLYGTFSTPFQIMADTASYQHTQMNT